MRQDIIKEFKKIIGENDVLTGIEDIYAYTYDNNCTVSKEERPFAVLLPQTTKQVSEIVKICDRHEIPIIARGAGTNHVGGCVAKKGGIILHFSKMNRIININPADLSAKVETGCVLGDFQKECEKWGMFFPPDPSNLAVSTVGGAIALSSGGPRGLKYGTTKDYVLNLEVVLADGTIINTGSDCSKNVAGYNLTQLFTGSEGTLGVITRATLRLIPKPKADNIILAYFDSIEKAAQGVNSIISSGIIPSVIDLLDKFTIQTIEEFRPSGLKTDKEAMLFIEVDGDPDDIKKQEEKIVKAIPDAVFQMIENEAQKEIFWTARRAAFGATSKLKGNVITEDVVVERTKIPELILSIKKILEKYSLTACIMGHAGDGNIHPNFALDFSDKDEMERFSKAKDELFDLAISLGGTVSGEHGIGFEKIKYLEKALDKRVIMISKEIKKVFDPKNIMNPKKVYEV